MQAYDATKTAMNNLKLALNIYEIKDDIVPLGELDVFGYDVDFNLSMKLAIENRRDFKRALNNIES